MPTLTLSGLSSSQEGLNDGYVQTGETYNGQPVWIGTRGRTVAYLCGGSSAGSWMFTTVEGYRSRMSECRGFFVIWPSGKRRLVTEGSFNDLDVSAVTIACSRRMCPDDIHTPTRVPLIHIRTSIYIYF